LMLEYVGAVAIWHIGVYSLIPNLLWYLQLGQAASECTGLHMDSYGESSLVFFLGSVMGTDASLQTDCSSRREKICFFSNRSSSGRGVTFLFCKKGDIITLH